MRTAMLLILFLACFPTDANGQAVSEKETLPPEIEGVTVTVWPRLVDPIPIETFEAPSRTSLTREWEGGREKFVSVRRYAGEEDGIRLEDRDVYYGDFGKGLVPDSDKGRRLRIVIPLGRHARD